MRFIFLYFLLFTQLILLAQSDDNISNVNNIDKKAKLRLLLRLAEDYSIENPYKSISFVEEALKLSKKQNDSLSIAKSYSLLANNYNIIGNYNLSVEYNTAAISVYMNLDDKENLAISYLKAGSILSSEGLWDKAKKEYSKALEIYFTLDDRENIAKIITSLKTIWELQQMYINKQINNYKNLTLLGTSNIASQELLENAAIVMYYLGNYDKSILLFLKAVKQAKSFKIDSKLPRYYTFLGLLYKEKKEYEKAIKCFIIALDYYKELKEINGTIITNYNLGKLYELIGNYDKALNYYLRVANIAENTQYSFMIPNAYLQVGNVYNKIKLYNKAEEFYLRSISMANDMNNNNVIAQAYYILGDLNEKLKKYPEAITYYKKSIIASNKAKDLFIAQKTSRQLSLIFAKQGDYKKAFEYQQRFFDIKDSILAIDNKLRLKQLEAIYLLENKDNEIQLLKKNNEIVNLKIKSAKTTKIFLLSLIIMIFIMLILTYNRYIIIKKNNILLKNQRKEIISKNAQLTKLNADLEKQKEKEQNLNKELLSANLKLKESEEKLIETNKAKDKFFSIISHDLRSPFASMISFAKILRRDIDKLSKEELSEMAEDFSENVTQINNLLENLLQWSRAQTGKIQNNPEKLNLEDIFEDNLNLFVQAIKNKGLKVKKEIEENLFVWADKNMVNTIIRNLISNAIKYSYQWQQISILANKKGKFVEIQVIDNGVGISVENQKKLFFIESTKTTLGTNYEKGSGLGLLLCKEFVDRLGGEIKVISEEGKGSKFIFTLPIYNEESE